jgi:hypothetical protein
MPKRPPLRALSIEGLHIPTEPIASGQTLVRLQTWTTKSDVYVIGWTYSVGSREAGPELLLLHGDTVLLWAGANNPAFYAEGAGYLVRAGEPVTPRLRITNMGAAGETRGAHALVYFVPADANQTSTISRESSAPFVARCGLCPDPHSILGSGAKARSAGKPQCGGPGSAPIA